LPKIFDCFQYFNEKELLELRLKLLYDYVDGFIISEANQTHTGNPKSYTCIDTIKELGISMDKITVIHLEVPDDLENNWENTWKREHNQRDVIANYFDNDSVYFISDCDEIIRPDFMSSIARTAIQNENFVLRCPVWYLHCRADLVVELNNQPHYYRGPFVCLKKHTEKYTLTQLRVSDTTLTGLDFPSLYIQNENKEMFPLGWHFNYMGGPERIDTKLRAFSHWQDYDPILMSDAIDQTIGSDIMMEFIKNYKPMVGSTDIFGRKSFKLNKFPNEYLPNLIFQIPHIKDFLLPEINGSPK